MTNSVFVSLRQGSFVSVQGSSIAEMPNAVKFIAESLKWIRRCHHSVPFGNSPQPANQSTSKLHQHSSWQARIVVSSMVKVEILQYYALPCQFQTLKHFICAGNEGKSAVSPAAGTSVRQQAALFTAPENAQERPFGQHVALSDETQTRDGKELI